MSNHRPISTITAEIQRSERSMVFTCGKLLLEAKRQIPHGKWNAYLREIDWHPRNAQLYMSVAELAAKAKSVSHLNAAPTALYQLVWIAERKPDLLPLAIKRLAASVARKESATEQKEAVLLTQQAKLAPGRTEVALRGANAALNLYCFGNDKRMATMKAQADAILKANPKTEEELSEIRKAHPIYNPISDPDEPDDDGDEGITNLTLLVRELNALDADTFPLIGLETSEVASANAKLEMILSRLRGDSAVKSAADRAEARTRRIH